MSATNPAIVILEDMVERDLGLAWELFQNGEDLLAIRELANAAEKIQQASELRAQPAPSLLETNQPTLAINDEQRNDNT